jgi:hypothetical protein
MRILHVLGKLLLCLALAGNAAKAQEAPAGPSPASSPPPKVEKSDWNWKEALGVATALIALLGTAVPQLAKSIDAYSLSSRSKSDLQRIDDLAALLDKVNKDGLLSPDALQNVRAQLEAEMDSALAQLTRTREQRDKALLAKHTQREIKGQRDRADLPLWRRVTLLYLPHGVLAWIAQPLFYLYAPFLVAGLVDGDTALVGGSAILMVIAWTASWFARRRWWREQDVIEAAARASAEIAAATAATTGAT